jgi:hypothetical protein
MRQLLIFICLLPGLLQAQDAPTIIPQNNNMPKDTARQTDLIDVAKDGAESTKSQLNIWI